MVSVEKNFKTFVSRLLTEIIVFGVTDLCVSSRAIWLVFSRKNR